MSKEAVFLESKEEALAAWAFGWMFILWSVIP